MIKISIFILFFWNRYAKDTLIELIHQIRGLNKSFHDMQKTEEQSRLRFNKAWMKTTQIKKNVYNSEI